jgi:predicted DNA-binding transcriptional regulator AlpA
MTLPYPPPWQDMTTLCAHICVSPNTVDKWVSTGLLPPPRKRGGKLMWKWDEVDRYLSDGKSGMGPESDAERIKNGTRRAAENRAGH